MTHTDQTARFKRLVHKTGITLFSLRFDSEELQELLVSGRAKEAKILLPISDLRKIRVKVAGGPVLELTTKALEEFDDRVSVNDWMAACAEVNAGSVGYGI